MANIYRVCLLCVLSVAILCSQDSTEKTTIFPTLVENLVGNGNGRFLVVAVKEQPALQIFDVELGKVVREIPLLPGKMVMAVGGDRLVISYTENDLLQSWNLATGTKVGSGRNPCPGPLSYLAVSADGTQVLVRGRARENDSNTSFNGILSCETFKPVRGIELKTPATTSSGNIYAPLRLWTSPDLTRTSAWHGQENVENPDDTLILESFIDGATISKRIKDANGYAVGGDDGRWYTAWGAVLDAHGTPILQLPHRFLLPAPGGRQFITIDRHGDMRFHNAVDHNSSAALGSFPGWRVLTYRDDRNVRGVHHEYPLFLARRIMISAEGTKLVMLAGDNRTIVSRDLSIKRAVESDPGNGLMVVSLPPGKVGLGDTWRYQIEIVSRPGPLTFAVLDGPSDARIDANGLVTWQAPPRPPRSPPRFVIAITRGSGAQTTTLHHTFDVTVTSGQPNSPAMAKVSIEAYPDEGPGRYHCKEQSPAMALRHDGNGMWLLRGRRLDALDESGMQIIGSLALEEVYRKVLDRGTHLLGIAATRVDLIDLKTGAIRQRIPIECIDITDLVANPNRPISYLALLRDTTDGSELMRKRLATLDETTGKITILDNAFGSTLAIHPDGTALYATLSASASRSVAYVERFGSLGLVQRLTQIANTMLLLRYHLDGERVTLSQMQDKLASEITALYMTPDGSGLAAYAKRSFSRPGHEHSNVMMLAPEELFRRVGELGGNSEPKDIAFHPYLDLVAIAGGQEIVRFYRRSSGEPLRYLDGELNRQYGTLEYDVFGRKIWFTPDGRSIVSLHGERGKHQVTVSALRLTDEDEAIVTKRQVLPIRKLPPEQKRQEETEDGFHLVAGVLERSDLAILGKEANQRPMKPADIAIAANKQVVTLVKGDLSATGLQVGPSCILTSSAMVGTDGSPPPQVFRSGDQNKPQEVKNVRLRAFDHRLGLALFSLGDRTTGSLMLEKDDGHQLGDAVVTISSPMSGKTTLDRTMIEGVVSNAGRSFGNLSLIQVSVAMGPGSQGGPVLGPRGNIIGMLVLGIDADRTSFAISAASIRKFLVTCTTKP